MRSLLLSCVFVLTLAVSAHGKLLTADQIRDVEPLLPYFTWLMDSEGKQSIATVSTGSMQERFAPLVNGIPLKSNGAVWLRLVIIKSPPSPAGGPARADRPRLVMRLGELPPGGAQMFISESPGPVSAQGVWHSETVTSYSDVLLPEPGLLPMSIYLRLDSMPGLWFAPTISPQGTLRPALLPSELLLPGLLIVACDARGWQRRVCLRLLGGGRIACSLLHPTRNHTAHNRAANKDDYCTNGRRQHDLVFLFHVSNPSNSALRT